MSSDILILGAGPAGVAMGLLMGRKGYSVEIVDSAFFPRTKICGEFLNPQAVRWLNENGLLSAVENMNPFPIRGMRLTDRKGKTFCGSYRSGMGYAIQRKDFDSLLVSLIQREGILLEQGFRAQKLLFEGDRVTGIVGTDSSGATVEKHARVLIGADGRNNLIGRSFRWMKTVKNFRKYAFLTYFRGVKDLQHFGEIHLARNGYIGVAPLEKDLANIALVIDETNCPPGDSNLTDFLIKQIASVSLYDRISNPDPLCPVITAGPLAYELQQTSGHGTILVGDTCGFLDPFTGEGINYALISASIAAGVLDDCFQRNSFDDSDLVCYEFKRRELMGKKLKMSRLLQTAVHSNVLGSFLMARFARDPHLANTMVSAVGSAIPVQEVWNPSFLFKVVFG
jgi:menaquinone-9 beta-reductase